MPATASLTDAENRCKTAITSILAGLADSEEKYEDATWSPNEDEANVLYVDGEKPSHDCSVEAPDSWTRLGELSDAPVLISSCQNTAATEEGKGSYEARKNLEEPMVLSARDCGGGAQRRGELRGRVRVSVQGFCEAKRTCRRLGGVAKLNAFAKPRYTKADET